MQKKISALEKKALLKTLAERFEKNKHRHAKISWNDVLNKLEKSETKLWSLLAMEDSGGEPDVIGFEAKSNEFLFIDCAAESPKGRRSYCYDRRALDARKENKPRNNVLDVAEAMGIALLDEAQYRQLQDIEPFDTKTSSWIITPEAIRQLGGALFGDRRYNTVFVYHNGADSYYAARGFRGCLWV